MPITVKEVVSLAASLVGRGDLAAEADGGSTEQTSEELLLLVRCYNLVESEVALDYFPLKKREKFIPEAGAVLYERFTEAPVNIVKVTDADGHGIAFEMYPARIELHGYRSEVAITYSFAPQTKALGQDSAFSGKISPRLLAFGVAAEFLLACGRFAEASTFEKKYREALAAAGTARKELKLRARRWV
ncbi:MAG: hypothetical protein IKD43_01635 [Clostridia bacterium]|nr:hypothetical protein [Clostridia bacterium]